MDINLLNWMAGLPYSSEPKSFDLNKERLAFQELLKLRENGRIEINLIDWQLKRFVESKIKLPDKLKEVLNHFENKISLKHFLVFQDSDLDKIYDELMDYLWDGQEKQDDLELFVVSHYADASITHVVTCDAKIRAKYQSFLNKLKKNAKLRKEVEFKKRKVRVCSGLPSEVLEDLRAKGVT